MIDPSLKLRWKDRLRWVVLVRLRRWGIAKDCWCRTYTCHNDYIEECGIEVFGRQYFDHWSRPVPGSKMSAHSINGP